MKTVKLFLITGLFLTTMVLEACSSRTQNNDADSVVSSEGLDSPSIKNPKKDSTVQDTIITPPDDNSMNRNNPDITK